jgi:murein DD-endopeptidase MepM/ murein hydrolase activator NlpD
MRISIPGGKRGRALASLALYGAGVLIGVAAVRANSLLDRPGDTAPLSLLELVEKAALLDAKLFVLESLLGIEGEPADLLAPSRLHAEYEELRVRTERIASQGEDVWARLPTLSPVPSGRITSPYTASRFHPIRRRVQAHFGLDIAAPTGTPILAAGDGVVVATANSATYGLGVDVDHGNGYISRYAHASRILVLEGQAVRRGQVIALVGSTGLSTGPHLHYEIFKDGWSVDPFTMIVDRSISVGVSDD